MENEQLEMLNYAQITHVKVGRLRRLLNAAVSSCVTRSCTLLPRQGSSRKLDLEAKMVCKLLGEQRKFHGKSF